MAKKPTKLRPDVAEVAFRVMMEATGQAPKTLPDEGAKNPQAVRRGQARAASLSPRRRKAIAKKAANARWKKAS